jgi:cell division septation protein DedD
MLSQISLVILAWLASLDPAAADFFELMQRTEPTVSVWSDSNSIEPLAAVQLELLPDHDSATVLANDMQRRLDELGGGLRVFVETVGGEPELPPSYRVGVGPFADFEQAERAQLTLERLGIDGFVRQLEPMIGC